MMRSMTGFGAGSAEAAGAHVVVEVRGVNQRHLDVRVQGAREYAPWESELRDRVRACVERGRVDVTIARLPRPGQRRYDVHVRDDLARAYVAAARQLRGRLALEGGIGVRDLLALPDLLEVRERPPDVRRELPAVQRALAAALRAFARQREREGRALQVDMARRIGAIDALVRRLRRELPACERALAARVRERAARALAGTDQEVTRRVLEVAQQLDRGDVTEEVVRLAAHVQALRTALRARGGVGKRIEFLLQEVQRELNTTGAKVADAQLVAQVLRAKEDVEKLREQVQNVE
jgi:uncharacterized protein (TIGR00255 family)